MAYNKFFNMHNMNTALLYVQPKADGTIDAGCSSENSCKDKVRLEQLIEELVSLSENHAELAREFIDHLNAKPIKSQERRTLSMGLLNA